MEACPTPVPREATESTRMNMSENSANESKQPATHQVERREREKMGEEEQVSNNFRHSSEPTSDDNDEIQALLDAARYDDIEDLVRLASAGVSLDSKDSQGRTALHMAAGNGHLDIVEYLIRNGADLNALNVEKNTPLHWACLNGHLEVIKALITAGSDVTILNCHERTPMDEAISQGKMEVINGINEAVAQYELNGIRVS